MSYQSVKSLNPFKSLPTGQAGVILTNYDIVKAHGGQLKVESKAGEESEFVIYLTLNN